MYLYSARNVLSVGECVALIEKAEQFGFSKSTVRTNYGPSMRTDIRNNDRVEFTDHALATLLWDRCRELLPPQIDGANLHAVDERFKFYRYDVSQRFNGHRDGIIERSPAIKSKLTALFYLNDDFTGGETVFYSEERHQGKRLIASTIASKTGDALFFQHEWWHEGSKVTYGRKYVLRTDVFYAYSPT